MVPSFCRRAPETKPSVPRGEGGYRPGDRVELASPLAQGRLESLRFRFLKLREGISRQARREGDDVLRAGPGACEREGADDVLGVRKLGDARNDRPNLGKRFAHSVGFEHLGTRGGDRGTKDIQARREGVDEGPRDVLVLAHHETGFPRRYRESQRPEDASDVIGSGLEGRVVAAGHVEVVGVRNHVLASQVVVGVRRSGRRGDEHAWEASLERAGEGSGEEPRRERAALDDSPIDEEARARCHKGRGNAEGSDWQCVRLRVAGRTRSRQDGSRHRPAWSGSPAMPVHATGATARRGRWARKVAGDRDLAAGGGPNTTTDGDSRSFAHGPLPVAGA
jgi:hypothetical protein